jgi:hypothetical protein
VPIEEGELLPAIGRITGWIEIDRDAPDPPKKPLPTALNYALGEFPAQRVEIARAHAVFERRDRWLRRERVPVHRISPEQQFVNRIVRIRMAAGSP